MKRSTLISLSPIVIVAGLFAAIAIPNLREALNRKHQRETMADIRTIATSWEARALDRNSYTVDPDRHEAVTGDRLDFSKLHPVPYEDLQRALVPTYIRTLPKADGWGHDLDFRTSDGKDGTANEYVIRSLGGDGEADRDPVYYSRSTTDFNSDLVFLNGVFLQYPESGA